MSARENNCSLKPRAQDEAWRKLVTISKALPQGLILVGPSGVGKRRTAKALFQLLNCQASGDQNPEASLFGSLTDAPGVAVEPGGDEPCGACVSCRKIAEGKHADLIEIRPTGENIAIEDLREMKRMIHFAPMESKIRFIIIDEAHKLSATSANTLLKTLEEPPAHTRFFLVTHERGLLLPTIVSRCQFLHFAPLDASTLKDLLSEHGYEIPERLLHTCLTLLSGGMDRAELLTGEKTLSFIETAEKHLASPAQRWTEIAQLADQLATTGEASAAGDWKLELLLDLVMMVAHRNARASRSQGESRRFVNRALEAAFLRRRLSRHANKKLIALAAADLTARAKA